MGSPFLITSNPLRLLIVIGLVLGLVCAAHSATSEKQPRLGLISTELTLDGTPQQVLYVFEREPGVVLQLPALISVAPQHPLGATAGARTVAVALPASMIPREIRSIRGCFLAFADGQILGATPVKEWTREEIMTGALSVQQLESLSSELNQKMLLAKLQLSKTRKELDELREAASIAAGVDGIIDLKLSLEKLRVLVTEKKREIERLRQLLERSRGLEEAPGVLEQHQELLMQLKEVARTTVIAERVSQKKKAMAASEFDQKIALIEKMQNYNPEQIARDVLRLRAERKDLEMKLSPQAPEQQQLDF